jgi:hypothetical protein
MSILSTEQISRLHDALDGRIVVLNFGAGVDSTAMIVALKVAEIRPSLITFADTGCEKPSTIEHIAHMNAILQSWDWPLITVCKKKTLPSTGYDDLYSNCIANETLPSLAFGFGGCSLKWKTSPLDSQIMGVSRGINKCEPHPVWIQSKEEDLKIVKLLGYDCGPADLRRSAKAKNIVDPNFDYCYPLQTIGWSRPDCVSAIERLLGTDLVPIKSACFMCPASKKWELYWLAANHPELLEKALHLERLAMTGRHSRFDSTEFGASWEEMIMNEDNFPNSKATVGLGRTFAWNQWARVNQVVDAEFKVLREKSELFLAMALSLQNEDNALDVRRTKVIPIVVQRQPSVSETYPELADFSL